MKSSDHQDGAVAPAINPGQTLREERLRQDLSLGAVARQLNLSERSLGSLEAGEFSQLPGHTFTRGYIRAYAKLLGLDQQRLVLEFDRFTGTDATGSRVHSLGHIEEPVRLSSIGLRIISFVVLLALGGIAFFLWQDRSTLQGLSEATAQFGRIEVDGADGTTQVHTLDGPESPAEPGGEPALGLPLDTAADVGVAAGDAEGSEAPLSPAGEEAASPDADTLAPAASTLAADSEAAAETTAGRSALVTEIPAAPAAEPVPVAEPEPAPAATPAPEAAPGDATLQLHFSADCWTRVTDANGEVLINALVPAKTTRTVQGKAPLSLVLGYARGVDLVFNGEPVDISRYRRGETARFQLGQ